nr:dTDP-4-dehydrorhamnose 3,5-epimerase family protein [Candidatus Pelagibacter ubique]
MTRINLKKINKPKKIKMKKFFDTRGFFQEIFLKKSFNLDIKFTALAKSKKNVIRGLHFQLRNKQTKLIYVCEGKILDIVVNLKRDSSSFGKVSKFVLKEGEILFIPEFYAHGYECLSKNVQYYIILKNIGTLKMSLGFSTTIKV